MRLSFAWLALTTLAFAACGVRSREPEAVQGGSAAAAGAAACAAGQDAYRLERERVLQTASSRGCKQDSDCGKVWETNACVSTCGRAVPLASVDAAEAKLDAFAKDACASCPPIPVPPCVPPPPLACVKGQCAEQE